jgi:hypothetical protein
MSYQSLQCIIGQVPLSIFGLDFINSRADITFFAFSSFLIFSLFWAIKKLQTAIKNNQLNFLQREDQEENALLLLL